MPSGGNMVHTECSITEQLKLYSFKLSQIKVSKDWEI